MKRKKLVSALALTLALVCAFTLGAHASDTLQEIKAYLNAGLTIKLNGEEQTMLNPDGSRIYPITYGGVNYLPVRAISNMLGLGVNWDGATQTILLGKQPGGVDLIDTYNIYHTGKDGDCEGGQVQTANGKTEDISGNSYDHWIYFTYWWGGTASVSYNLEGKHDTLTFSYYSDKDVTLKVLGDDGNLLGEYAITGGAVSKTVTVPLFKTRELKFEVGEVDWANVRIMDARLDAE